MNAPPRFRWLGELPPTQLRICLTLIVVVATAVRYLYWGGDGLPDFSAWLTFLTAWAVVDGSVLVGKRMTSDPEVIAAETAARQVEPLPNQPIPVLPDGQP